MGDVMSTARTEPEAVAPGGEDGTDPAFDPEHRTFQRMSIRGPALIVLGIAVFILVAGVVASILAGSSTGKLSLKDITLPDGTTVVLTPATTALKPIISSEPPADILASLAVPAGSIERHFVNTDQDVAQYDRSITFTSGLSSDQLLAFYQKLLPKLGWKVTAVAPDTVGLGRGRDHRGAGHQGQRRRVLLGGGGGGVPQHHRRGDPVHRPALRTGRPGLRPDSGRAAQVGTSRSDPSAAAVRDHHRRRVGPSGGTSGTAARLSIHAHTKRFTG